MGLIPLLAALWYDDWQRIGSSWNSGRFESFDSGRYSMSTRGGRRPGAGRPPKHAIYESPIRAAERQIRDKLPWIVDKLLELVDGVHEEKMMGENAVIVYKRPPDRQAAEYLVDRIMGKPSQPVDIYDAARQLATDRGLDPEKVVSIYDGLKKKRTG